MNKYFFILASFSLLLILGFTRVQALTVDDSSLFKTTTEENQNIEVESTLFKTTTEESQNIEVKSTDFNFYSDSRLSEPKESFLFDLNSLPKVVPYDSAPRILKNDGEESVSQIGSNLKFSSSSDFLKKPLDIVDKERENNLNVIKRDIVDVDASLRNLQREAKKVEKDFRTNFSNKVDVVLEKATRQHIFPSKSNDVRSFNIKERQEKIEILKKKIDKRQEELSSKINEDIVAGNMKDGQLEFTLKSSLEEIGLLIEAETGFRPDFSPTARTITSEVFKDSIKLDLAKKDLLLRGGLQLYADSDKDGVSDYDEKKIYKTDPKNAFTAGGSLTDGERILLGLNVFSTTTEYAPVESPLVSGDTVEGVFEVYSINLEFRPIKEEATTTSSEEKLPVFKEFINFSGKALPNSFVTLYIFSNPVVVTVKTDISGTWTYTLDQELENGNHELHLAVVDAGGKILVKSPSVPFVKRAEAVEFTPLNPNISPSDPLDTLMKELFFIGGFLFLLFIFGAIFILGRKNDRQNSQNQQSSQ